MLYIKVWKWKRESSNIGPESLKMWSSTQKESNHFWKSDCLTVWSFLHPRIALRISADKYRGHANTSTTTAVAGIIVQWRSSLICTRNEILAIPILLGLLGNLEVYSPRIMKLWGGTFSVHCIIVLHPASAFRELINEPSPLHPLG